MPVQDGDRRVFYLQCFCLVMLEKFTIWGDAKQVKDMSMVPIPSGDTVHTENMTDIVSCGLLISIVRTVPDEVRLWLMARPRISIWPGLFPGYSNKPKVRPASVP
jgi:hypothetical protein